MAFSGVWPFRHVRVDEDPLITVSRSNSSSVRTLALRCRHSACDTLLALVITARTCRYTCRESRRGSIIRCMESAATTLTVRVKIMGRDARLTTHAQPLNKSRRTRAIKRPPSNGSRRNVECTCLGPQLVHELSSCSSGMLRSSALRLRCSFVGVHC